MQQSSKSSSRTFVFIKMKEYQWIEKCWYAGKKIWHRLSSDDYLGSQSRNDEKLVFLHKKSFSRNFADFARRAALHIETNAVWISCLILPFLSCLIQINGK